jgi:hypothetical protein
MLTVYESYHTLERLAAMRMLTALPSASLCTGRFACMGLNPSTHWHLGLLWVSPGRPVATTLSTPQHSTTHDSLPLIMTYSVNFMAEFRSSSLYKYRNVQTELLNVSAASCHVTGSERCINGVLSDDRTHTFHSTNAYHNNSSTGHTHIQLSIAPSTNHAATLTPAAATHAGRHILIT